jgi:hypothetical protein
MSRMPIIASNHAVNGSGATGPAVPGEERAVPLPEMDGPWGGAIAVESPRSHMLVALPGGATLPDPEHPRHRG